MTALIFRKVLGSTRTIVVQYGIVVVLALLVITAAILYPGFFLPQNLLNILSQNAPIGIVAIGMTIVMLAGGFDLSVGAMIGMGATFYASFALKSSLMVSGTVAIVAGFLFGSLNGLVINRLRVNPFIATLGFTQTPSRTWYQTRSFRCWVPGKSGASPSRSSCCWWRC
jgi:ribose transport system permease protein